ncbi:MAG: signal recognition particle-docking protein FtsY [Bosea sp.]|nr:signal recognition particle-docking protein FtsY [Bosea sp. (in: a-proteobacteria)]
MTEEKKGFFQRIFGRGGALAEPQPAEDEALPPIRSFTPIAAEEPSSGVTTAEQAQAELPAPATAEPETAEPEAAATETAEPVDPAISAEAAGVPDMPAFVFKKDRAARPAEESPPPTETAEEPPAAIEPPRPSLFARPAPPEPAAAPEPPRVSWFQRLKAGLSRSSNAISQGIASVFTKRKLDAETLEEFEDVLIQADLGLPAATAITAAIAKGRFDKEIEGSEVKAILAEEVAKILTPVAKPLVLDPALKPHVILVVGVNGTGKTTTIGKLSAKLRAEGRSVMLAAGDTFRAAAVEQLKIWGERTGAKVISRAIGADAAGLAFDALKEAEAAGTEVLIIDTAGRLQNRAELMAELEKIIRVIKKQDPAAPHTVLMTLDATTGQNALSQVEIFGRTAGVTGLVMTKLDGTARGGILVAIAEKYRLPIHFIGVGEGVDDLEPFEAEDFARAIAGLAG